MRSSNFATEAATWALLAAMVARRFSSLRTRPDEEVNEENNHDDANNEDIDNDDSDSGREDNDDVDDGM
eukprot:3577307-Karenia_brevis.AAC.1